MQVDRVMQKMMRPLVLGCVFLSGGIAQGQITARDISSTRPPRVLPSDLRFETAANEVVRNASQASNAQNQIPTVAQKTTAPSPPEPPVYVEGTFGNDRFDLQTFISKRFKGTSKAGILSITSAQGQYNNDTSSFDFVNVTQLNYEIYKGISPTLGIALNRQVGFNTTIGLQYIHAKSDLLFVVAPSVFVSGTHDVQNVLAVLYQPQLRRGWSFYGNLQILDDYIFSMGLNARSFAHVRLGATKSQCTFGIGTDLDWYGMPSDFRTNVGPFIGYSF